VVSVYSNCGTAVAIDPTRAESLAALQK
jgi:hypothetical protein